MNDIKIGENIFYVNMSHFYRWNKFFTSADPLENKELILKIKVERVAYDSDQKQWLNHTLKSKYAFKTENEAKDFVIREAKKDNLNYEQEIIDLKTRILHNDKMVLKVSREGKE